MESVETNNAGFQAKGSNLWTQYSKNDKWRIFGFAIFFVIAITLAYLGGKWNGLRQNSNI